MISTRKGIVRASITPRMLAMVYELSLTGSLVIAFGIGVRMRGERCCGERERGRPISPPPAGPNVDVLQPSKSSKYGSGTGPMTTAIE